MTQINLKTWEDMKKEELHTKANLQMKFCESQGFDQWIEEEFDKWAFENLIRHSLIAEFKKQISGEGK